MKLLKLLIVNCRRALRHKLACVLYLRESNYISQAVCTAKEHRKPVKTYTKTAVRRCGILVCVNKEAELFFDLLIGKTEKSEHSLLKLRVCDTNRTTAKLDAIEYKVISLRSYLALVGIKILKALLHRHRERMVHSKPAFRLIVPLEERELGNP